jgi:serine/threonine-protein kinase ULK/ATG1
MAPEILRYEKYDAKADLWSVGTVLYEMATGKPPFRAQNHVELLRKIERGEDRIRFPDEQDPKQSSADGGGEKRKEKPPGRAVADDIKRLCRALLKRNPVERMGFEAFFEEAATVATAGPAKSLVQAGASEPPTRDKISPDVVMGIEQQEGAFAKPSVPVKRPTLPGVSNRIQSSPAVTTGATALARRQPVFAPKYVVGGSTYPSIPASTMTKPVDIVEGVKVKDYHSRQQRGNTPPELAAGSRFVSLFASKSTRTEFRASLEDNTPSHPPTPRSDYAVLSSVPPSHHPQGDSNEDSVVGRDYVVVEKGTVEINALADGASLAFGAARITGHSKTPRALRHRTRCFSKAATLKRPTDIPRLPHPSARPSGYRVVSKRHTFDLCTGGDCA